MDGEEEGETIVNALGDVDGNVWEEGEGEEGEEQLTQKSFSIPRGGTNAIEAKYAAGASKGFVEFDLGEADGDGYLDDGVAAGWSLRTSTRPMLLFLLCVSA
jgi:hypothetical protein